MSTGVIDSFLVALGFQTDVSGADKYKKSLDDVGDKAGAVVDAIGAVSIAIAGLLTKSIIETAAQFEKFEVILSTLEGSDEKGRKAMDWVSDFAAKTPYELAEVTDAFIKLRSYGLDPTNGLMKTLGDTASAMGKPVMAAVEAIADAVTGQNERLKEFGITSQTVGNKVTYSWIQDGETKSETVDRTNKQLIQSTLESIWNEKYAGNMEKLSKSWNGIWSNISDTMARVYLKMSKGIFPIFKKWAEAILKLFSDIADSPALDLLSDGLGAVIRAFEFLLSPIVKMVAAMPGWAAGALAAAAAAITLGSSMYVIGTAATFIGKMLLPVLASIGWIPALIGAVAAAVVLLIDDFLAFKDGQESFIGDLVGQYPQLLEVVKSVGAGISSVLDWLMGLFNQIKDPLMELGGSLIDLFKALWPVIKLTFKIVEAVLPVVVWVMGKIVSILAWVVESVVGLASGLIKAVNWVVSGIAAAVSGIAAAVGWLANGIVDLFHWAVEATISIVLGILDAIGLVGDGSIAGIKWLANGIVDLFSWVVDSISKAMDWTVGDITGAVDLIADVWKSVFGGIFDWYWDSLKEMAGGLKDAFNWLSDFLGLSSGVEVEAVKMAESARPSRGNPQLGGVRVPPSIRSRGTLGDNPHRSHPGGAQVQNSTNITGTVIKIESPDPEKAGESVRREFNRFTKLGIRNGQSGVAL